MEKNLQESTNNYISKLNNLGLPYSFEILDRDSTGYFSHSGLDGYKDIPNVDKLILLTSKEHKETQDDIKFLVVETYKYPTPEGHHFGVPKFSYVAEDIAGQNISCYQLNDDTPTTYKNIYEALSKCVSTFELDNFQKGIMIDVFSEYDKQLKNEKDFKDFGTAQLSLAKSVFDNYNQYGKDLFSSELDKDRLIVSCKKYDAWTDIVYTGDSYSLAGQVNSFLADTFPKYINETTDIAKLDCEMEVSQKKVNKNKINNKPV